MTTPTTRFNPEIKTVEGETVAYEDATPQQRIDAYRSMLLYNLPDLDKASRESVKHALKLLETAVDVTLTGEEGRWGGTALVIQPDKEEE